MPHDLLSLVLHVATDRHAKALDEARGMVVGRSGDALLEALEEANEEAARTHDEREPRVEGEHQELNLIRGEWGPGDMPIRPGEIEAANPDIFSKVTLTAKHPVPYVDDAPEPPKRQEHDPPRRWACPKCTSVLAVDRIFEIVAGRGERYAHVVRCLCGEVRP